MKRDMSPHGKVIATLKILNGIDAGGIEVPVKDYQKSCEILKNNKIEIAHTADFPAGKKTIYMDAKYITTATDLLDVHLLS